VTIPHGPSNQEKLLDSSLQSALAAIEIYNKPDFRLGEECFVILCIKSWESLLKAKIVLGANGDFQPIYASGKDGRPKTGRSGNKITIDVLQAAKQLSMDAAIEENLRALVEIRDTAVHLFLDDESIKYLVFTLGAASLQNYQSLASEWFNRSLLDYNFYILPLAFAYGFQTLSPLDLEGKPEAVANLLRQVSETRERISQNGGYHFVCELQTSLVSAKKLVGDADITAAVNPDAAMGFVLKWQRPIDKYPYSYSELFQRVKIARPLTKQSEVNGLIKRHEMKNNLRYSYYNFSTKAHDDKYKATGNLPKVVASIYSEDAVSFLVSQLE
jgi:hypothetical protein